MDSGVVVVILVGKVVVMKGSKVPSSVFELVNLCTFSKKNINVRGSACSIYDVVGNGDLLSAFVSDSPDEAHGFYLRIREYRQMREESEKLAMAFFREYRGDGKYGEMARHVFNEISLPEDFNKVRDRRKKTWYSVKWTRKVGDRA